MTDGLDLRQFEREQHNQQIWLGIGAGAIALIAALSYVLVEPTTLLVPILLLTATLLPAVFWRFPRFVLYGIFGSVCLFEVQQFVPDGAGITDAVPFFWNINSMFEKYLGTNPKVAPINYLELVLILFAVVMLLRYAVKQRRGMDTGSLFWPIAVYLGFVTLGWANGMTSGGNFNEALQEVRAQFYFGIAYFLAVNAVRDRRQVEALFWLTALTVAFKAVNYIFRWVTVYHAQTPDQGVGSHEEAFFFMAFILLLNVLSYSKILPRLQVFMWLVLPLVLFANVTTNRRTAYAALMITLPLMLLSAYRGFPKARRGIVHFLVGLVILGPPYFFAFRQSSGPLAAPARAIQSSIAPDERDSNSNVYRDAENYNLLYTMRSTPVTMSVGYGYGKRFLTPIPLDIIKDIYPWYNLLPHNQILWVWMRVGTLGFLAFWGMMASVLVYACRVIRRVELSLHQRAVALYTLGVSVMLLIFGLLDLQLSNFRDMIFVAIWIGAMTGLTPKGFTLNDPEPRRRRPGVHYPDRPTRRRR